MKGKGRGKGSLLNSALLTPKPPASGVYVHVPEAPSPLKRSISVMSPFPPPSLFPPLSYPPLRCNRGPDAGVLRRPGSLFLKPEGRTRPQGHPPRRGRLHVSPSDPDVRACRRGFAGRPAPCQVHRPERP